MNDFRVSWVYPNLHIWIPSRESTYPTLGKGKSSSNMPFWGDMLVPRRVFGYHIIWSGFPKMPWSTKVWSSLSDGGKKNTCHKTSDPKDPKMSPQRIKNMAKIPKDYHLSQPSDPQQTDWCLGGISHIPIKSVDTGNTIIHNLIPWLQSTTNHPTIQPWHLPASAA